MNELIKQLTTDFKLTPEKAEAGIGAILSLVQERRR